jgi:hypothetical protein
MGKPGVLVFVHGYNVAFDRAAERSAQLAYDLSFPGPTVFFAWPSQGQSAQYLADAQMAEYSVVDMKDVLSDLAALVPGGPVYVIAHSMGNRVLARGFAEVMAVDPGKRRAFKEIVLAAPDIDADVFKRDIAPKFLVPGPRFTLYANSRDRALEASESLHGPGSRRLGQGGDRIAIFPDMDSIDATRIKTDFLAHSYFGDSETLLSDLFYLIRQHLPPDARGRLEPVVRPAGKYWRFKPDREGQRRSCRCIASVRPGAAKMLSPDLAALSAVETELSREVRDSPDNARSTPCRAGAGGTPTIGRRSSSWAAMNLAARWNQTPGARGALVAWGVSALVARTPKPNLQRSQRRGRRSLALDAFTA